MMEDKKIKAEDVDVEEEKKGIRRRHETGKLKIFHFVFLFISFIKMLLPESSSSTTENNRKRWVFLMKQIICAYMYYADRQTHNKSL